MLVFPAAPLAASAPLGGGLAAAVGTIAMAAWQGSGGLGATDVFWLVALAALFATPGPERDDAMTAPMHAADGGWLLVSVAPFPASTAECDNRGFVDGAKMAGTNGLGLAVPVAPSATFGSESGTARSGWEMSVDTSDGV